MGLATKVLIGLVVGLVCGLFFGERIAFIGIAGQAFILLLQMTVLPYIAVSLVVGLGGLTPRGALDLAKRAGVVLLGFWALTLGTVTLVPLAFPNWTSASFFSTSLVAPQTPFDLLSLFIPANPFRSLAESVVPSVVVFSIAVGLALMGLAGKVKVLEPLRVVMDALGRITMFVVRLAPYGVFAIVAQAAGTMQPADVKGLEVYAVVYAVMALVLTLWAIPGLVVVLTPLRYRDVVWYMRDALITAFATGNLFVVLAVLAEKSKQVLQKEGGTKGEADNLVDVVVPTAFTFPSSGVLLSLSFVLFAGWVSGFDIPLSRYPAFLAAGLASFFGATVAAVPFLLNLFQIPADTFQLFLIADNVVGSRFGSMLAAMHILGLALLSACAVAGLVRFRPGRIAAYAASTMALALLAVGGVRLTFEHLGGEYEGYRQFVAMRPLFDPAETRILEHPPQVLPAVDRTVPTLDRIRRRGFLRLGYRRDTLPYVFRNNEQQLVGFDVDLADVLARELGVELELVHVETADIPRLLAAGYLDTVLGGMAITTDHLENMAFAQPHHVDTLAFIVPDYRRQEFSTRESVQRLHPLRLAIPDVPYYIAKVEAYLPQAELVPVQSVRDYFRDGSGRFDGLVYSAEAGSAWSLVYPQFSVAVPRPDILKVPVAFPVARGDTEMVEFLGAWVRLKKTDGTLDRLFEHWILGKATQQTEPRWSVIRNVLGWVD